MDVRTYPGDGRDSEHLEHGRWQVPKTLEEIGERRARAAGGGLDVALGKLLLAGEGQGNRHADDDEDLIETNMTKLKRQATRQEDVVVFRSRSSPRQSRRHP